MNEENNNETTSMRISFGKFVYKIDIKATLDSMEVGETLRFKLNHAAHGNVYATSRRLRNEKCKLFSVALETERGCSVVTRIK